MKRGRKQKRARNRADKERDVGSKSRPVLLVLLAAIGAAVVLAVVFFAPMNDESTARLRQSALDRGATQAKSDPRAAEGGHGVGGVGASASQQPSETAKTETVPPSLTIAHPFEGSVFPPEIVPPVVEWTDTCDSVSWTIEIAAAGFEEPMQFTSRTCSWSPPDAVWEEIKRHSVDADATIAVHGVDARGESTLSHEVRIRTSSDEVGAPIFYREVNLPFEMAVKDPATHVRWRFGSIDSTTKPPIVLENMPLCGNCHSFSADGSLMGMDVDYGSDSGSYVICPVSSEMVFDDEKIITWSDYRREDNRGTFGLLSRVSPDGRYVVSTVKDRSVFVEVDNLAFSQLFFPIQGILAYRDRETKTFHALPGAEDPTYVQSNAVWSPDGQTIVFARAKAYRSERLEEKRHGLLDQEDVAEFLSGEEEFKYDLYRVPWNNGQGGEPEPLLGASKNGLSNYFPKYSPDGKWIVFCRAENFMLLQEDSDLYIIPSSGGEARRLKCNTERMNSWHSWSPNGKWLVFSSKRYGPYTKLFLTHVDDAGRTTPPVCLTHFTESKKAANIPEFVNAPSGAIQTIDDSFIDDESYLAAGKWNLSDGNLDLAVDAFQKAIELNPENTEALRLLSSSQGLVLLKQGQPAEAEAFFREAIAFDPRSKRAYYGLACALDGGMKYEEAVATVRKAIEIDPEFAAAHELLGKALLKMGRVDEGRRSLLRAAKLAPEDPAAYMSLAGYYIKEGDSRNAVAMFRKALDADPASVLALIGFASTLITSPSPSAADLDAALEASRTACELSQYKIPSPLITLSDVHMARREYQEAADAARRALPLVEQTGNPAIQRLVETRLDECRTLMGNR